MEFASDLQRQQLIMQSVTGAAFNVRSAGKGEEQFRDGNFSKGRQSPENNLKRN